jgi:hypothetical protein
MLYYWLLFFFVTIGAKLVLALITIYFLLPSYRSCNRCDEDTLLVRTNAMSRIAFRLFFGRVQWRWCPRCGWEGLARTGRRPFPHPGISTGHTAPTRH